MPKNVTPKRETEAEKQARETVQTIAETITNLADAVRGLSKGPLNKKALIVLLAHASQRSQAEVKNMLDAIESLDKNYLDK